MVECRKIKVSKYLQKHRMELINLVLELRIVYDFHETRGPGTEKLEEKQARAALCSSFSLVHEIVTISG